MRLLRIGDDGEFSLVEFVGKNIPRYAILSHTWEADDEEVRFKDLVDGGGKSKIGYSKIRFCGTQAAKDGLQHFWVDTCCIDKSSSAELSEAINSMFRWYHEAVKCYVYLSDVSTIGFAKDEGSLEKSKWFTRGWTLQELVAPTSVEFFSLEEERLGDKISLERKIIEITGIPIQALQGRPLSQFSVEERMAWAERRETTRDEDAAYSLLGIFNIHMPLLYGEGRQKAFIRLRREIHESLADKEPIISLVPANQTVRATTELHGYHNPDDYMRAHVQEHTVADAQRRILDSLQFAQIQERRYQIDEAQEETYQWILRTVPDQSLRRDDLVSWLSSSTESRKIYWISGKPGSGKSTLMRYLDQNIVIPDDMLPWTENRTVLYAQYFFWNPGHKLQKSINGLLRTLLTQLLEIQPHLIPQIVHRGKWTAAQAPGHHLIDWTNSELRRVLHEYILSVRSYAKVFLLLDGLDELDGSDDAREEVINVLLDTARHENVKICVSSRPWNIFRDAFGEFPQLRLEYLTSGDIHRYVAAQLRSHIRFQHFLRFDRMEAESLISEITNKAAGVFLWVRLVVRELRQGLRDGDGITVLRERLKEIPGNMNDYFRRLMDSISPHHRKEASELLQIALFNEPEFATGQPLRLIDMSFIGEGCPDFVLTGQYNYKSFDLKDREGLQFRLDSTMRRLNSRCMGLLECQFKHGYLARHVVVAENDAQDAEIKSGHAFGPSIYPQIFQGPNTLPAFKLGIDFLHRSCRDFLQTSEIQSLLHQYSHGPYDSRMFLLSSRLSQFMALETAGIREPHAVAIASYILSTLSLPIYKNKHICAVIAATIQPTLERLIRYHGFPESIWYIDPSIASWQYEKSSFLTLAIDFDLTSYVKTHMNREYIREKRGRPILDYILRPRFAWMFDWTIANRKPNLELLGLVLQFGGEPNCMYQSVSVWALFLCFLADVFREVTNETDAYTYSEFSGALRMLIRAGAAPLLPKSWLARKIRYNSYYYEGIELNKLDMIMGSEVIFSYRWPDTIPTTEGDPEMESESWYSVSNLLEHFRPQLGSDVDELKWFLDTRT